VGDHDAFGDEPFVKGRSVRGGFAPLDIRRQTAVAWLDVADRRII
jgi:hypothetical protein